jgi:hypothetical protein
MSDCSICEHVKVDAIDASIDANRLPAMVAQSFRVNPDDLRWHVAHRAQEEVTRRSLAARQPLPDQALPVSASVAAPVTETPLSQFKQAWHDAKDDDRIRASMLAWLDDQLRDADMGLP